MARPETHKLLGDVVRWQRPIDRSWKHGRLVSLVDDVVEVSNDGGRHSIRREYVEVRRFGPRGGAVWRKL